MPSFSTRALAWLVVVLAWFALGVGPAAAFCGFYVGKADASLFNEASQVIMVRRDNRTVISMANDRKIGDVPRLRSVDWIDSDGE